MPRRKPFSNKQKKLQLQEKRTRRREKGSLLTGGGGKKADHSESESAEEKEDGLEDQERGEVVELHSQPLPPEEKEQERAKHRGRGHDSNRFCLHFEKETDKEIRRRKYLAKTVPISPVSEIELEVGLDEVYLPGSVLDMPRRPSWSYSMSKAELETKEEREFSDYLRRIHSKHKPSELSYFEQNLETWRQLWRVLEISDVVLLITDIRHPVLHFSPALYNYVVQDLKKHLVLVLNKVDLVPAQVGVAWRHYFLSRFPDLEVISFTSYPNAAASTHQVDRVRLKLRRRQGRLPSAVGPQELLRLVEKIYSGKIDTSGWRQRLDGETTPTCAPPSPSISNSDSEGEDSEPLAAKLASSPLAVDKAESKGVVTIGMVGYPNVGKSSLINALMGKKRVSTSRTPGHTKHFQTLYLTPSLRVCDCPGLVFPSLVDKKLQILSGIYPIAQVREPYSAVGYLAERVSLTEWLQLVHPEAPHPVYKRSPGTKIGDCELYETSGGSGSASHVTRGGEEWTAWDICDAWAIKRGYFTSRAARPDAYRAANSILRLAVDGKISLYFRPPGYAKDREKWARHPEVAEMIRLQQEGMTRGGSPAIKEVKGEEEVELSSSSTSCTEDEADVGRDNMFTALGDSKEELSD